MTCKMIMSMARGVAGGKIQLKRRSLLLIATRGMEQLAICVIYYL